MTASGITSLTVRAGGAPYCLTAVIIQAGRDIQIYIGGGGAPHIGSVAISQPRPGIQDPKRSSCTTSVVNILGHKDETVSVLFAEAFCKKFKRLTAVSAGVHIEKARPGDIEMIVSTARALLEKSLARWEKTQNL